MIKYIWAWIAAIICILVFVFFSPYQTHSQGWSGIRVKSLPDSSFALIEIDKDGRKVRHLAYRDIDGTIDIEQLIYCLGTFADETWIEPERKETARRKLEEHYYRFTLKQSREGIREPIDINAASLKDLVRLPNVGPVTAVRIYRFRENQGPFQSVDDIKKVEGIGPAIFAGIRYYIRVR
ncbi:MAG: ComEA family DNA-binding protein [Desulfobacterales bacterium]|nr:ComEA family DNA-binding protein [Desulfobacterales bacterium]